MAVTQFNLQGINRAVSDYAADGACEELINLRPTGSGLVPVRPLNPIISGTTYDRIFTHKAGDDTNYITIDNVSDGEVSYFYIDHVSESGSVLQTIFQAPGNYDIDSVHFATAGNYIVISIADDRGIHENINGYYTNVAFIWDGTTYKEVEADIPSISASFSVTDTGLFTFTGVEYTANNTEQEVAEIINTGLNAIQLQHKEYCFGPTLVAIAFKTTDGNTFWTGKWTILDPIPEIDSFSNDPPYKVDGNWPSVSNFNTFFTEYDKGYFVASAPSSTSVTRSVGVKYSMTLAQVLDWSESTSIIKSVEIYTSRPSLHADALELFGEVGSNLFVVLPQVPYSQMGLDGQLLYLQKSISLKDLSTASHTFTLEFGGNEQLTNRTLEVDAGAVTRYGKMLSYNSRFHFYDSISKTEIGMPFFSTEVSTDNYLDCDVFVNYDDGGAGRTYYVGTVNLERDSNDTNQISVPRIVASNSRIKEVMLYYEIGAAVLEPYHLYKFSMKESSRYNYSINTEGWYLHDNTAVASDEMTELLGIKEDDGIRRYVIKEEDTAINVTEQYNPFVFRVEHSYLAPGAVLDMQPQMVAVADVSYGDYPLNVFTNKGVYALLQGGGNVLYGAFRPISNLVSECNSISTDMGTFIIAAGQLWLISGSTAVLVSEALSRGPHTFIRSSAGYQSISYDTYGISSLESVMSFKDFVGNEGRLSYNRFRDELIVSSDNSTAFSYVLSLKYRQWFKVDYSIYQDAPGDSIARLAADPDTGRSDILDFSYEAEDAIVQIHIQSRPFSFGYQYTHIHRIVEMIRSDIQSEGRITVALYGSDDLQEWKLLTYAHREEVKLSQVRTAPAARSWRYYTVCIDGEVPYDTDLGPVLVDYVNVVRRIG